MITAEELMIGNYVLDRGGKILRIDYWECKNKIAQYMGTYLCEPFGKVPYHPLTEEVEFLKPITLTEEWLIKFGFTKYSYGFMNKILIRHPHKDCYELRISDNLGYLEIKYIHQLQNIHYALTGEQLTIKKQ